MKSKHFVWKVGVGPSTLGLGRLRTNFPKPSQPMGEAWFMSDDRKTFTGLLVQDFDLVTTETIEQALWEISSGSHSFGVRQEWLNWWGFLLSELLMREDPRLRDGFLERLVTASMAVAVADQVYYIGLRDDLLSTLGQTIMSTQFWAGSGDYVYCQNCQRSVQGWFDCSSPIAASIMYLLFSLEEGEIIPWVDSIVAIDGPVWRASILAFILSGHDVFYARSFDMKQLSKTSPCIDWEDSYLLPNKTFNEKRSNIDRFFARMFEHLTAERLLEWCEVIWGNPQICDMFRTANIAEQLMTKIERLG